MNRLAAKLRLCLLMNFGVSRRRWVGPGRALVRISCPPWRSAPLHFRSDKTAAFSALGSATAGSWDRTVTLRRGQELTASAGFARHVGASDETKKGR